MRQPDDNGQESPETASTRARARMAPWFSAQTAGTGFLMFLVLISVVLIGAGLR